MKIIIDVEPSLSAGNSGSAGIDARLRELAYLACGRCMGGQCGDIRRCTEKECPAWPLRLGAEK